MDPQMDLLQAVKDAEIPPAVPDVGSGEFEMPTLEKLLEALEGMDMSEEEKENIKKSLLDRGNILSKMGAGMQNMMPPSPVGIGGDEGTRFMIFAAAIVIVTFIFDLLSRMHSKRLTDKISTWQYSFGSNDIQMSDDQNHEAVVAEKVKNLQEKLESITERIASLTDKLKELPKSESVDKILNELDNSQQSTSYLFIVALFLIVFVFAFFGYKLYKSLTEKERKREEKKKQKQQKKKK